MINLNKIISQKLKVLTLSAVAIAMIAPWTATEAKAASTKKDKQFTVVLDAGHGGHDHGAIDNNAREKDINIGVANKLAELIAKKMKNVNVVMTRDDDTFISLQERANIANRNHADLFVSIHTNSVDKSNANRSKISGASVYVLGPQKEANNLEVAQRENSVIELESDYKKKYSGFDPSSDESYIIFGLSQKQSLSQSLKFANIAQKELVKTAGRADRGVKQAGFWVLWATSMPSVLVELDFICNPTEAQFLTSSEGQDKLAQSLFNAIQTYFDKSNATHALNVDNNITGDTSVSIPEEQSTMVNTDEDIAAEGVVLESDDVRTKKQHVAPVASNNIRGPRKRRSSAAREKSNLRVVETDEIEVKKEETTFLAISDDDSKKENEVLTAQNIQADNKKKNNNKKEKKKEPKKNIDKKTETKADKNAEKKKEDKKPADNKKNNENRTVAQNLNLGESTNKNRPNRKVIKVPTRTQTDPEHIASFNKETEVTTNVAVTTETKTPRPIMQVPMSKPTGEKMFKILLLSSDKELSANDPVFAGFTPTEVYKENNQYKYVLGGSSNRREVENKLFEIKSNFPEATIVFK